MSIEGIEGINVGPTTIKLSDRFRGVGGGAQKLTIAPLNSIPWTRLGSAPPRGNRLLAARTSDEKLPKEFSWTNMGAAAEQVSFPVNKSSITKPVNQGCCGSCWAWSTVTALADRHALANNEAPKELSPSLVLSCCNGGNFDLTYNKMDMNDFTCINLQLDAGSGGCQGGFPYAAALQCIKTGAPIWTQTQKDMVGVVTDSDCPDMGELQSKIGPCPDAVDNANKVVKASGRSEDAPHYISADVDSNDKVYEAGYYANAMKKALLKGPIVGTYMVLGDFMALGTELNNGFFTWDKTGGVYVPGAPYTQEKTNASSISKMSTNNEKLTVVEISTAVDGNEVAYGDENKGFHSVVIVGWGMQPVKNVPKGVEAIDGKIPYWIIRNSWGKNWPTVDGKPYYDDLPLGYWKHAMRTKGAMNASLGMDQPFLVKTEDSDGQLAGATLVLQPEEASKAYKSGTSDGGGRKGNWWLWLIWSVLVVICLGGIIFCVYNKWPMKTK